jgi:ubiquinone/menaquinone biosynthesis C-methylase UbiE
MTTAADDTMDAAEAKQLRLQASEAERIRQEYAARAQRLPSYYYSLSNPAVLFARQSRERALLKAFPRHGLIPLRDRHILDVGCGSGQWLVDFETWGARRANLAGIDLIPDRVRVARTRLAAWRNERGGLVSAGADIREGDAARLPWPDSSFDIVCQSMALSSILEPSTRAAVAREMARVLRDDGVIIWYDMFVPNPRNPGVRGIHKREIEQLFDGFVLDLRRVTLLQPLARRIVPVSRFVAELLEAAALLNTHFLGILRRQDRAD